MTSYRLLLLPAFCLFFGVPQAHAQNYGIAPTPSPKSTARTTAQTRALIARTQQRVREEEERRRSSIRYTDPRATFTEQTYRGGRLTSGTESYSTPIRPTDNRAVLVPQR